MQYLQVEVLYIFLSPVQIAIDSNGSREDGRAPGHICI